MSQPTASALRLFDRASPYGIWTLFLWIMKLNANSPIWHGVRVSYAAIGLTFIAIALLYRLTPRPPRPYGATSRRINRVCGAGLLLVGTVIAIEPLYTVGIVPWVTTAVGGIFAAVQGVQWAALYRATETRTAFKYLFGGCVVWILLQSPSPNLPILAQLYLVVPPLLGSIMLNRTQHIARHNTDEGSGQIERGACLKVWATIFGISIILMTIDTIAWESSLAYNPLTCGLSLVVIVALLWYVLHRSGSFTFTTFWRIAFIATAFALTMVSFDATQPYAILFFHLARSLRMPFVWFTACDLARRAGSNSLAVIALSLSAYAIPSACGAALFDAGTAVLGFPGIGIVLFLVLFVVFALCLGARDPDLMGLFGGLRADQPPIEEFRTIANACATFGRQRGLTEREIEVMRMACEGRSRSYIAETLLISENTVKTHMSHIYEKLGVHSKRELQQLIGV